MKITYYSHGTFRLDGGAMFGSVPKNIWAKRAVPDEQNRILLAQGSLIIEVDDRKFIIDLGMGDKWGEKEKDIYQIKNETSPQNLELTKNITDIILTHLHFDHAGGISKYNTNKQLITTFPNAKIHIQKANVENAKNPNRKEKASYLKENVLMLDLYDTNLIEGTQEICSNIIVHRVDGHTVGQQWVEIILNKDLIEKYGSKKIFFTTDLIPTHHHIHPAFSMGYDMYALKVLQEKEALLERAYKEEAIILFQHDVDVYAGTLVLGKKGFECKRVSL